MADKPTTALHRGTATTAPSAFHRRRPFSEGSRVRLVLVLCFFLTAPLLAIIARLPAPAGLMTGGFHEFLGLDTGATWMQVRGFAELHLIQACLIFVILYLIVRVSTRTQRKYVRYWARAWAVLLVSYCLMFLRQSAWFDQLGSNWTGGAVAVAVALSVVSSLLLLLAAQQLNGDLEQTEDWLTSAIAFALLLGAWVTLSSMPGAIALADSALGTASLLVCALQFGHHRYKQKRSRPSNGAALPAAYLTAVPFVLYAAVQPVAFYIHLHPQWTMQGAVFGLALILKVVCSLTVVLIATTSAYNELESKHDELAHSQRRLGESQVQLLQKNEELEKTNAELEALNARQGETNEKLEFTNSELQLQRLAAEAACSELRRNEDALQKHDVELTKLLHVSRLVNDLHDKVVARVSQRPLRDSNYSEALGVILDGIRSEAGALLRACPHAEGPRPVLEVLAVVGGRQSEGGVGLGWLEVEDLSAATIASSCGRYIESGGRPLVVRAAKMHGTGTMGMWVAYDPCPLADDDISRVVDRAMESFTASLQTAQLEELLQFLEDCKRAVAVNLTLDRQLHDLRRLGIQRIGCSIVSITVTKRLADVGLAVSLLKELNEGNLSQTSEDVQSSALGSPLMKRDSDGWRLHVPILRLGAEAIGEVQCIRKLNHSNVGHRVFGAQDVAKARILAYLVDVAVERNESEKARDAFLAAHLHEIGDPINCLKNAIRWIRKNYHVFNPSEMEKILSEAADSAVVLQGRMDEIDSFRGKTTRRLDEINLALIIDGVTRQHRPELVAAGVDSRSIEFNIDPSIREMPRIRVCVSEFSQILRNLVGNAIKYRKESGAPFLMRFGLLAEGEVYKLLVSDYGIGVPLGWEERIFEFGKRAPNAMKSNMGRGIGLSISRELARRMDGDLSLVKGADPTTFALSIPRRTERKGP